MNAVRRKSKLRKSPTFTFFTFRSHSYSRFLSYVVIVLSFSFVLLSLLTMSSQEVSAMKSITITDGWHTFLTEETFPGDGLHYKIYASEDTKNTGDEGSLFIQQEDKSYLVGFGECEDVGLYHFCFQNKSFTEEHITKGVGISILPALQYSITKDDYTSQLKITKKFSTTKPHLNEEVDAIVRIENTGDTSVNNVALEEVLPKGFIIGEYDRDFVLVGDKLTTTIYSISPGETWSAEYRIIPKNKLSTVQRSVSRIQYQPEQLETKVDDVAYQEFNIVTPYSTTFDFRTTSVERTTKLPYTFTFKNNEEKPMHLTFAFTIPSRIDVIKYENLSKQSEKYSFEGDLEAGESRTWTIELMPSFTGTYNISFQGDVRFDEFTFPLHDAHTLLVTTKKLSCNLKCDPPMMAFKGENEICNLTITNPSSIPYYSIEGIFTSPVKETTINMNSLAGGKYKKVYREVINTSTFKTGKQYFVSFSGKYKTSRGEYFNCTASDSFNVRDVARGGFTGTDDSSSKHNSVKKDSKNMTFVEKLRSLLARIFGKG